MPLIEIDTDKIKERTIEATQGIVDVLLEEINKEEYNWDYISNLTIGLNTAAVTYMLIEELERVQK